MILDIGRYDAAEREARISLGYAQLAAFGVGTFSAHGYPTRITDERELFRYTDFIVSETLDRLKGGQFFRDAPVQTDFTVDEITLLTKISNAVGTITERASGRRHQVIFNHLSATGQFRAIHRIGELFGRNSLAVFEVGPGCGYVGALLGLTGHRYASYDITQALYVWQNRLFAHLFGDEFVEYAGAFGLDGDAGISARLAHLPWWDFLKFQDRLPFVADVVLSNANLCEMHSLCRQFVLKVTRRMFEQSDIGLLVFGNIGSPFYSNAQSLEAELEQAGFVNLASKWIYVYGLKGRTYPDAVMQGLESQIPLYDPTGLGKTFAPKEFVPLDVDTLSDEFKFYSYVSNWPAS